MAKKTEPEVEADAPRTDIYPDPYASIRDTGGPPAEPDDE